MLFSIAIMLYVLMALDDVVSGKVVEIALELGKEDVTVGVGKGVDIMLLYEVGPSEMDINVEDNINISVLIEVEYVAELLDSIIGFEVV